MTQTNKTTWILSYVPNKHHLQQAKEIGHFHNFAEIQATIKNYWWHQGYTPQRPLRYRQINDHQWLIARKFHQRGYLITHASSAF